MVIQFVQRWFRDIFWRPWHVCCGSFCVAQTRTIWFKLGQQTRLHLPSTVFPIVRFMHMLSTVCFMFLCLIVLYIYIASQVCHRKLTSVIWTELLSVFINFECRIISVGETNAAYCEGLWTDLRNLLIRENFYKLYTQDSNSTVFFFFFSLFTHFLHLVILLCLDNDLTLHYFLPFMPCFSLSCQWGQPLF